MGAGAQAAGERRTMDYSCGGHWAKLANVNKSFWIPDSEEAGIYIYMHINV